MAIKIAGLEKGHADQLKELDDKFGSLKDDFETRGKEADKLADELATAKKSIKGDG